MNLSKILAIKLAFVLFCFFPARLLSQEKSSKDMIPGFYKIDGKDFFCTEKYHKLAEDGNKLKFCQKKLTNCLSVNVKSDNIINICEAIKKNIAQQLSLCEEISLEKDNKLRIIEIDNELLSKENKILRDEAKIKWFESPFLWFGIGFATSTGILYIYNK